jgi:chromate transporter
MSRSALNETSCAPKVAGVWAAHLFAAMPALLDVFAAFLKLGCISFGGPVAHLGYFQREFVHKRKWLDDAAFAQCVALTQLLPGPASSQTGMLIGWIRAGAAGAIAAWVAFTLPSALLMTAIALALPAMRLGTPWLHFVLLIAVGVVASALVKLRAALAPDAARIAIALAIAAIVIAVPLMYTAPLSIVLAAGAGFVVLRATVRHERPAELDLHLSQRSAYIAMGSFVVACIAIAWWASGGSHAAVLLATMLRVGSLVFGGGHVVLPLLQTQAVSAGIVDQPTVLAGYAAAQAMPGPLFTIAAFIGAAAWHNELRGWGAAIAIAGIFGPSFFLLASVAPFYRALAANVNFRAALAGANAGVVGLLAAAFVTPIWRTAVHTPFDALVAAAAFVALHYFNVPAWVLVILAAACGFFLEH